MSEQSRLSRGRPRTEPQGPVGELIAEYQGNRSLGDLAALYKKIAKEKEGLKHATCSPSTFRKWLRGERIPEPFSQRCISAALDIPIERLNQAIAAQRAPANAAVDSDSVKRRSIAAFLAMAGASAAVGVDLHRFAAVLAGTRVDTSALDDMETLTAELIRREATLAPSVLLPAVRGHLAGLHDLLVWTPPALAARAYSLAGQTALLAGYLMSQQERPTEADTYWSLADRFADMAGDTRLRAAILVHQGWRWEYENRPLALALLDRAESLLGPDPDPATAAMVLSVRAARHSDASLADPTQAPLAMRDMDGAESNLSRMPAAEDGLYLFRSVAGQVMEQRGHALVNLGQHQDALAILQQGLDSMDPSWLAIRSYVTTDLGAAVARMGEPEHACDVLSTSVKLAASASSPRCMRVVRHKQQRWLAGHDSPAARRLEEQLKALALPPSNVALPPS